MSTERDAWDEIVHGLAEELGLTVPSETELGEIAKSLPPERLSEERIEEIVSAVKQGKVVQSRGDHDTGDRREAYPEMPPPSTIGSEMAFALNRNRGPQEPDVEEKLKTLREKALKDDGDGPLDPEDRNGEKRS